MCGSSPSQAASTWPRLTRWWSTSLPRRSLWMRTQPPTVEAFKSVKKSSLAKQSWNNCPSAEEDERSAEKTVMYYVNDGVYGSFNCILYDHAHCLPTLHKVRRPGGSRWRRGFPESPAAALLTPPPTFSPLLETEARRGQVSQQHLGADVRRPGSHR